jgi:mannose-6-phosphate isomerase-like protein (cupin superfamily)
MADLMAGNERAVQASENGKTGAAPEAAGHTGSPAVRATRDAPIIRRLADTPPVPCPCGTAYRVVSGADGAPASVHFVDIRADSDRHYHCTFTELYVCLEGSGFLEIDGRVVALEPGTVAVIERGQRHRAFPAAPDRPLRILNVAVPPFAAGDEWLD